MTDAREALPEPAPMPDDEASGMFQYWHREPGTSWADLIRRVEKKTADEWRAYTATTLREEIRKARVAALDEAAKAADDVDEPAWYGHECPNTFNDGKQAAAAAIRALASKEAEHG